MNIYVHAYGHFAHVCRNNFLCAYSYFLVRKIFFSSKQENITFAASEKDIVGLWIRKQSLWAPVLV